jgi:hypothetical protein
LKFDTNVHRQQVVSSLSSPGILVVVPIMMVPILDAMAMEGLGLGGLCRKLCLASASVVNGCAPVAIFHVGGVDAASRSQFWFVR